MQIGSLKYRIEIYSKTTTTNTYGEKEPTYTLVRATWSAIESSGGNETLEINKTTATNIKKFTIRYRSGITEDMLIKYAGDYYNIRLIEKPDYKRTMIITAEKKY